MSDEPPPKIGVNDVLRFGLELTALVGIVWGLAVVIPVLGVVVGLVGAVVAAILWGLFRSPRARFPLAWPGRVAVETVVMGAGAFGFWAAGVPVFAATFAILAVISGAVTLHHEEHNGPPPRSSGNPPSRG